MSKQLPALLPKRLLLASALLSGLTACGSGRETELSEKLARAEAAAQRAEQAAERAERAAGSAQAATMAEGGAESPIDESGDDANAQQQDQDRQDQPEPAPDNG